jgi:hypothetical protein
MSERADRLARRFATNKGSSQKSDATAERWDDANRRFTVWLPLELILAVKEAAARNGESISAVVTRLFDGSLARRWTGDGRPSTVDRKRSTRPASSPLVGPPVRP